MANYNRKFLSSVLKVTIVLLAAWMLFSVLWKFFTNASAVEILTGQIVEHGWLFALVVLMIPLNWFLETAKWKLLITVSEIISWKDAWRGVLAGIATGSATPNRIGEFAGRIFQLKNTTFLDGFSCTLISSLAQVLVTVILGGGALFVVDTSTVVRRPHAFIWVALLLVVILVALLVLRSLSGKWQKYVHVFRMLKLNMFLKVVLLSLLRYLVYMIQFWIMLRICGIEASTSDLLAAIAIHYFVVTIIPSFMVSDLFVRGAVASGVIGGLCGQPEIAAIAAVIIWIMNIGIPALCGVFFVPKLNFIGKSN